MNRIFAWALVMAPLLACAPEPKTSKPAPAAAVADAAVVDVGAVASPTAPVVDDAAPPNTAVKPVAPAPPASPKLLDEATFRGLMEGLAECPLTDRGLAGTCAAMGTLGRAMKTRDAFSIPSQNMQRKVEMALLDHAAPSVRYYAAHRLNTAHLGGHAAVVRALLGAAASEREPQVLSGMLNALGPRVRDDAAVRAFIMERTRDAAPLVRRAAVSVLTGRRAVGSKGTLERVAEIAEKDADEAVRIHACRRLGLRGEATALPTLKRLTAAPDKVSPELYAACAGALVEMWAGAETPSRAAYRASIAFLKRTPRTKVHPPWGAVVSLGSARGRVFKERAPWFKEAAVVKVLEDIVLDRATHFRSRTAAVEVLVKCSVSRARFRELAAAYADTEGQPGQDKRVLKRLRAATQGR